MAQRSMVQPVVDLVRDPVIQCQWWAAFGAGFIALLPLMLSVDLYIDDLERAIDGSSDWVRVGRPLADALVEWVSFGRPLTAVAPLYTLVAIALLSVAGVASARAYGIRSAFWTAVSSVPLMAQPYALQAMSYGFDALFMALALLAAIAAALVLHCGRDWRWVAGALGLLLVAFNLYQPAANGFLVMSGCLCVASALELLDRPWQRLSLRRRLLLTGLVYAGGYGLYRLLIALLFEPRLNGYALESAELLPFNRDWPRAVVSAALEPSQWLIRDFGHWPVILPFLLLVFSYGAVLVQRCSLRLAVAAISGFVAVLLLAPGGLLLLSDSFARHPRVLLYFGPLAMSLILQLQVLAGLLRRPLWSLGALPLIWLMVVVSYAYGHAFAAQEHFEQGRLSRMVGAASLIQARGAMPPAQFLLVEGTMPRSPVLQNTVRQFPLIDRLIPPLLDGDQSFSFVQMRLHGLDLKRHRSSDPPGPLPSSCLPSADAICTNEFSLQRLDADTLLLRLSEDPASRRPRT